MVVTVAVMFVEESLIIEDPDMDVPVGLSVSLEVWLWSSCEEVGSETAVINGLGTTSVESPAEPLLD